jgi:hypothetical protein
MGSGEERLHFELGLLVGRDVDAESLRQIGVASRPPCGRAGLSRHVGGVQAACVVLGVAPTGAGTDLADRLDRLRERVGGEPVACPAPGGGVPQRAGGQDGDSLLVRGRAGVKRGVDLPDGAGAGE